MSVLKLGWLWSCTGASMGRAPPLCFPPLVWECCMACRRLWGEMKMFLIRQRFEIPF